MHAYRKFDRRSFIKGTTIGSALALTSAMWPNMAIGQESTLSVFGPLPPDPAPPGAARFFGSGVSAEWQKSHGANVKYDLVPWAELHDKMATAFASGEHVWDVVYMCAWVSELSKFIRPYASSSSKGAN